ALRLSTGEAAPGVGRDNACAASNWLTGGRGRSARRRPGRRSGRVETGDHGARNVLALEAAGGELAVGEGGQRLVAQPHRARLLGGGEEVRQVARQPLEQAGCGVDEGGEGEGGHWPGGSLKGVRFEQYNVG